MRVRERGGGGRTWERVRAGLATAPPSHCVEAFTAPELTPAIALYERFGFAIVGRRPRYYADGEDALVMCYKPVRSEG